MLDAIWTGGHDVDLTVVTPQGTRLSWMGGRINVVGSNGTSPDQERLGLKRVTTGSYVIEVTRARGRFLRYQIDHPEFLDSRGNPAGPFVGEVRIADSTWAFFLGDTFWEPWSDKTGPWRLRCWIDDECVADKAFMMEEGASG